ncbi:GDSL-type esterase/lipase family protein [Paludibaculum fermentans]|uniref:SGNH hydrolase-type esterase domain-containing protein n=1 Tax=Paludibaculum fermentans TaxID=1473598 RepID=A0A7S7NKB9_PALFE|nr:GDSL-type esterase/lipase family protein [Paludibaculum fermentans]QOY85216.1 hypothetical protein IRI77_20485 [Paludibaculum fermentans]
MAGTRKVVVLGSSSAAGVGATRYELSWVGLLTSELRNRGFEVVNSSISGSGTSTSLARFDSDVTPQQPDFVVLATSIFNEGFVNAPQAAWSRYIANTRELIRRTRELGAIPIVVGMYPSDFYTATNIALISQLYRTEETLGVPMWDFWSIVSDPTGNWLPGLTRDGLHPTDAGHSYFFNSIPLSLFDIAYRPSQEDMESTPGSWQTPTAGEGLELGRIDIALDRASDSWTSAAWIQDAGENEWRVYLRFGSDQGERYRLERHATNLVLREGESETLLVPVTVGPGRTWRHVAVSYQFATRSLRVYLDGLLVGQYQTAQPEPMSRFEFGSGCLNCSFSDLAVYRSNLDSDQLAQIMTGLIPRRSLEFWAPLRELNLLPRNLARTNPSLSVSGAWQYQSGEAPALCGRDNTQQQSPARGSEPSGAGFNR